MAPKEEYKAKPSAKSELNKPKGGKAKVRSSWRWALGSR
jgi:hypothetical protein